MVLGKLRRSKEVEESHYSTKTSRVGNKTILKRRWFSRGLFIIIASLLLGFGGGWLGATVHNASQPIASTTAAKQELVASESELIADIAKETAPGVVSIEVQRQVTNPGIFGFNGSQTREAAGTGFIINSDGMLITNRHVVPAGTSSVRVTLADNTVYDNVQVIGRTPTSSSLDVAFLKITDLKGKKLKPLMLGDSSKVEVGERVIAIGYALGEFENTVTSGIISGFGRDVTASDESGQETEVLTDLFQTDAAINAGNSGGPLVNIEGEVIGINTAVAGGADNIGFAIPINSVKSLISSVLKKGVVEQPFLGVRYISLTDEVAAELGINIKRGAYVLPSDTSGPSVIPDSPAAKAGLQERDIITKVDGIKIDDKNSLSSALARFQVGDSVRLTVIRQGHTMTFDATLTVAPQE
jgi:serine protease Do